MVLDGLTLLAAGCFVTAVTGLLLIGAWTQIRTPALMIWAAASFSTSVGIALIGVGFSAPLVPALALGSILGALASAMVWAGTRSFNGRRQIPWALAAGTVVIVLAGILSTPDRTSTWATLATFAVNVAYLAAAAAEIWPPRPDRLGARTPLALFILLHALMFVGGVFDILNGNFAADIVTPFSGWFSLIQFETMVYSIGTSVFMVLLCKQRSENRHIFAARHDTLTGIVNRGAFIEAATRVLERQRADAAAVSLIMFDLDRFKSINDTYGHSAGDEVIRLFTVTTQRVLRPNDIFGRYGGEEFALMLPGATVEVAHAIGERIRYNFARAAVTVDGRPIGATISGGIATAAGSDMSIETLLGRADRNLYRAKHRGRNRIERDHGEDAEHIARIA